MSPIDDVNFNNGHEFFTHREREDGKHDLIFGQTGMNDHNHAVFDNNGNLNFLRENNQIKADDKWKPIANTPIFNPPPIE